MSSRNAERFMHRGVIVQEVVDAVAPDVLPPTVGVEQIFDRRLRHRVIEVDRALVDHERQDVVGDEAVVLKDKGGWLLVLDDRQDETPADMPEHSAGITEVSASRSSRETSHALGGGAGNLEHQTGGRGMREQAALGVGN